VSRLGMRCYGRQLDVPACGIFQERQKPGWPARESTEVTVGLFCYLGLQIRTMPSSPLTILAFLLLP
jgi:hypothetical protein